MLHYQQHSAVAIYVRIRAMALVPRATAANVAAAKSWRASAACLVARCCAAAASTWRKQAARRGGVKQTATAQREPGWRMRRSKRRRVAAQRGGICGMAGAAARGAWRARERAKTRHQNISVADVLGMATGSVAAAAGRRSVYWAAALKRQLLRGMCVA